MVRQAGAHTKKLELIARVPIPRGKVHISEGIAPVRRLSSIPKTFKRLSDPIVVGRDPPSEFDDSCKVTKEVIDPMDAGKLPCI